MKLINSHPKPIPTRSAVLLIFMPPEQSDRAQRVLLKALTDSLQQQLGDLIRILRIDEATHPDIFQSFEIIQTPAFLLVRQGAEVWRQVGMPEEDLLTLLPKRLVTT